MTKVTIKTREFDLTSSKLKAAAVEVGYSGRRFILMDKDHPHFLPTMKF